MVRAFWVALIALLLSSSAPLQAAPIVTNAGRSIPVPSGPATQVASELGYVAFPFTVKAADGLYIATYRPGTKHNDPEARFAIRTSRDLVAWDEPWRPPWQTPGYWWGAAGIAAESDSQGGRVYAGVAREHFIPGSQTVDHVLGYLIVRSASGVWSGLKPLPTLNVGTGFLPSSLLVSRDGALWVAGYAANAGYVFRSTDHGEHWSSAGRIAIPGRSAVEPVLAQTSDGRILAFLRSDSGEQGWLHYAQRRDDGSWSVPVVITYDGSGLVGPLFVGDTLLLAYRGFGQLRPAGNYRPMRLLTMRWDVASQSLIGVRGNVDITPGQTGRFLYGSLVERGPNDYVAVHSVEGPAGRNGTGAFIVAQPFKLHVI